LLQLFNINASFFIYQSKKTRTLLIKYSNTRFERRFLFTSSWILCIKRTCVSSLVLSLLSIVPRSFTAWFKLQALEGRSFEACLWDCRASRI